MEKKIAWSILAVIVLGMFAYAFFGGATVSAQGSSSMKVQPDKVSIYLSIESKNKTAEGAKDMNVITREKTIKALERLGLDDEIKLLNYNIYPEYDWENGQKLIGYVARYDVIVESDDLDIVPSVIDITVESGAAVSYISFELSEERRNEYKAKALAEAARDAKTKAEATAEGLGKGLGRIVKVDSENFDYYPIKTYDASMAESSLESASKISPNELDVNANIRVTYKLRPF